MVEEKARSRDQRAYTPTTSAILNDGALIEMVFNPGRQQTFLATYSAGRWTLEKQVQDGGIRLVPFSADNNLAAALIERYGNEYEWPVTNRWIGALCARYGFISSLTRLVGTWGRRGHRRKVREAFGASRKHGYRLAGPRPQCPHVPRLDK
jgi:hypothetical protein